MGKILGIFFVAVVLTAPLSSFAATIFDAAPEEMLRQSAEVRQRMNLSVNQATLWFQVEAKSRDMVRERQARRERLLAELGAALSTPAELRELAKKIDAEEDISVQENRRNRELWLGIDDALDDRQRQSFHAAIIDQLGKKDLSGEARKDGNPKPDSAPAKESRSGRRGRGGDMGGGMSRF